MRLALFQPDIPQNLGAAIRLTACLGVGLDIIEPCGFPLSGAAIRRAAMDYAALAEVRRHAGWRDFETAGRSGRLVLFTTRAAGFRSMEGEMTATGQRSPDPAARPGRACRWA